LYKAQLYITMGFYRNRAKKIGVVAEIFWLKALEVFYTSDRN